MTRSSLPSLDFSRRDLPGLLLWLAFASFFFTQTHPRPIGPDPHGYWFPAKSLVEEGRLDFHHPLNDLLRTDGQRALVFPDGVKTLREDGRIFSTYPVGQSLAMAALYAIFRLPEAMAFATPLFSLALLALAYLFTRRLSSPGTGLLAMLLLGLQGGHPSFFTGILSDPGATFFSLAGLLCFLPRDEEGSVSPFSWALGGFSLGTAVLFRAPHLLFFAGPLLAWFFVRPRLSIRHLAGLALGSLPPALAVAGINHLAYGSAFATGYGSNAGGDAMPLFSWRHAFLTNEIGHGRSLPVLLLTLLQGLYVLPFFLPWTFRKAKPAPATRILLGVPFLLLFVLLCTYAFEAKGWDARFALPFFALLGPLGLVGIREAIPAGKFRRIGGAVLALFLLSTVPAHLSRMERHRTSDGVRVERAASDLAASRAEREILVASDLTDPLLARGAPVLNLQHAARTERLATDEEERRRLEARMESAFALFHREGWKIRFVPGDCEADRWLEAHLRRENRLGPASIGYAVLPRVTTTSR